MVWHPPPEDNGDPELAATMRRFKVKAPVEKIVRVDWLLTALNREKLADTERMVTLECGHLEVTKRRKSAPCSTCHAMILNGEDYDAFRNRR